MYGVLNSTYCMPCSYNGSNCEVCYQQNVSHCMQCYNEYGADNGLCKLCTLNCETCKTTDWNYCLTCVYNNTLHRYNISGNVYEHSVCLTCPLLCTNCTVYTVDTDYM
jgi:hypothetical protein